MSHLLVLKFANAEPARLSVVPVERAPETITAALSEQKSMAEAKIVGSEYSFVHIVRSAGDNCIRVEARKRLRPGWFADKTFCALRYVGKSIVCFGME